MYAPLRDTLLRLLKAPREAPEAPGGSHASVEIFRASPRFLTYRLLWMALIVTFLMLAALALVVVAAVEQEPGPLVAGLLLWVLLLVVGFLVYFAIRVDYELRYYVVTDRSLRVREGAWTVREMTLTYANVQNLKVAQGPLQRAFGISNLELETAGGGASQQGPEGAGRKGGHNVKVAGVENAREIRDTILAHMRAHADDTGLGDLDDRPRGGRGRPGPVAAGLSATPEVVAALRGVSAAATALAQVARRQERGPPRPGRNPAAPR
jgi:membrane protein YdbS with pleckstrin-like domain